MSVTKLPVLKGTLKTETVNGGLSADSLNINYAEDEENDVFFLERALKIAGSPYTLKAVRDGQQAIDYFSGIGPFSDRLRHPCPP